MIVQPVPSTRNSGWAYICLWFQQHTKSGAVLPIHSAILTPGCLRATSMRHALNRACYNPRTRIPAGTAATGIGMQVSSTLALPAALSGVGLSKSGQRIVGHKSRHIGYSGLVYPHRNLVHIILLYFTPLSDLLGQFVGHRTVLAYVKLLMVLRASCCGPAKNALPLAECP